MKLNTNNEKLSFLFILYVIPLTVSLILNSFNSIVLSYKECVLV